MNYIFFEKKVWLLPLLSYSFLASVIGWQALFIDDNFRLLHAQDTKRMLSIELGPPPYFQSYWNLQPLKPTSIFFNESRNPRFCAVEIIQVGCNSFTMRGLNCFTARTCYASLCFLAFQICCITLPRAFISLGSRPRY